jgi:tetratricopeptide (TPR) repeat protein
MEGAIRGNAEPVGTLQVALANAARLLESQPALAAEQAAEILAVVPGQPHAMLLLGRAKRACGDPAGASEVLASLTKLEPDSAVVRFELALNLGSMGQGEAAVAELRTALAIRPEMPEAWRLLADHLTAVGDTAGADAAYAQHIRHSTKDPRLLAAAAALCDNRLAIAETLLREHLTQAPTDVAAIRMLAEVAARLGRFGDSALLLERCLELAPGFAAARFNYATVLHRGNRVEEALREVDRLLILDTRNPGYRNLKAALLARIGEFQQSLDIYGKVLGEYPRQAKVWMSYGHALKAAGQRKESIDAYRRSIELAPQLGEAYWSLANLKRFQFEPDDVAAMTDQVGGKQLTDEDRLHFEFALGKAREDEGAWEESFRHYERGNALKRTYLRYDATETTSNMRRSKALLTKEFFRERAGSGAPAGDPIFIVGLPRAGSTLLEQILASHPAVEGTMELPNIIMMSRKLGGRKTRSEPSEYPELLARLAPEELRSLGELYLQETRIQRKTPAPFFIDKMPNNFAYIGLIHLILPHAKIIDARRHPLGCCFSAFKQQFARGQGFTYSLDDVGRYYRDYVELMAHFDAVLPGRVHRVIYEELVGNTETEVRRLLDYCALPFDERCLRFFENERAVRTASSEQVRTPIYREGIDHWRHFEPWLGPLKDALGPVLENYPAVPDFA